MKIYFKYSYFFSFAILIIYLKYLLNLIANSSALASSTLCSPNCNVVTKTFGCVSFNDLTDENNVVASNITISVS